MEWSSRQHTKTYGIIYVYYCCEMINVKWINFSSLDFTQTMRGELMKPTPQKTSNIFSFWTSTWVVLASLSGKFWAHEFRIPNSSNRNAALIWYDSCFMYDNMGIVPFNYFLRMTLLEIVCSLEQNSESASPCIW